MNDYISPMDLLNKTDMNKIQKIDYNQLCKADQI